MGAQQDHHFKQLFALLKVAGYEEWAKNCQHINFGSIKGMSTRRGEVVFLKDVMDEAKRRMLKTMAKSPEKLGAIADPEAVADLLGQSAIFVQDMTARRIKDYSFHWKRVLCSEGDTGVYLQYTHARLCAIERRSLLSFSSIIDSEKCGNDEAEKTETHEKEEEECSQNPQDFSSNPKDSLTMMAQNLIKMMAEKTVDLSHVEDSQSAHQVFVLAARFPEIVMMAANQLEPCVVVNYAFSLARAVSTAVEELHVLGSPEPVAMARLVVFISARIVLGNALVLLGLVPLERM